MPRRSLLRQLLVPEDLDQILATMNKPVGSMNFDPWGFNRDTNRLAIALFKWLYVSYFRVITTGLENIPASGRCLVIANHSGQLPIDGALLGYAMATNPVAPRAPRAMIERFLPTVPFIGNLLNEIGAVVGDPVNCRKMLESEEAVIVFPEGVRGAGKLFRQRYQLQRFGNGFMHLAINHRAPIIPVGIVGCEETIISLANIKPLARLLGIPYAPLALPAVLPARVHIHIGEPMVFDNSADTEEKVTANVEQVKSEINRLIRRGLNERKGIFI